MAKDNTSASSASSGTNLQPEGAPGTAGGAVIDKTDTTRDGASAAIAARNAASSDAQGVDKSGSDIDVARAAADKRGQEDRDAQDRKNAEKAAVNAMTPRLLAEAGAALAAHQVSKDWQQSPGIKEQKEAGTLPDPVELALKARGGAFSGRRLDETIEGGLTVHPDGYFKNAHGEEIDNEGKVVEGGNVPRIDVSGARVQTL